MRVLFVNQNKGFLGGVEQYIFDTIKGLNSLGYSCSLIYEKATTNQSKLFSSVLEMEYQVNGAKDLNKINFESFDMIYFHKVSNLHIYDNVIESYPSCVMVHDYDYICPRKHKYYAFGNSICSRPASPLCVLDAGFIERDATTRKVKITSPFKFWKNLKTLKRFRKVVVASHYMKKQLQVNSVRGSVIEVIPPCIKKYSGVEYSDKVEDNNLLYVGQIIKGKGIDLLLKSIETLDESFTLNIVGTGNYKSELEFLSKKLNIVSRVNFHGYKSGSDLEKLYHEANALIVPSRWAEPFGMVGVEAMAFRTPVIAFDVGGVSDWLKHGVNGYLCHGFTHRDLRDTINKAFEDRGTLLSLGEQGYKMYQNEFSASTYFNRMVDFFERNI